KQLNLLEGNASVGRSEQPALPRSLRTDFAQQLIAPANIFQVIGRTYVPPAQVVKGVVADAVTFSCKALKNLRILADVIADTKKSCLQCVAFKRIQDKLSRPRNRAVVEGQVELITVCGQPPMKG